MKMRVETCHAVDLVERRLGALRKSFEFRFGEKAVSKLDGSKVVEDLSAGQNADFCDAVKNVCEQKFISSHKRVLRCSARYRGSVV